MCVCNMFLLYTYVFETQTQTLSAYLYLYFRAETEVEGAGKLSGQDKALLSAVWIPSLVYALMSRQV